MPHAAPTSTAPTSIAPTKPAACLPLPPAAAKSRGNPNRGLAPAQPARGLDPLGARTRCLCHSPAIHGKFRCRMHGGRGPGPRTPETLSRPRPEGGIRVRDARTIHGNHGAKARAFNRFRLTQLRISRVDISLDRYQAHLPPAPSANRPPQGAPTPGPIARFKPSRIDPLNRERAALPGSAVPFKPFRTDPLNRERPARSGSTVLFKPSRIDPLNRERAALPGSTVPFKPSRIDPLNRERAATSGSTVLFKPFRIDPLNREPTANPGSTAPPLPPAYPPCQNHAT